MNGAYVNTYKAMFTFYRQWRQICFLFKFVKLSNNGVFFFKKANMWRNEQKVKAVGLLISQLANLWLEKSFYSLKITVRLSKAFIFDYYNQGSFTLIT